MLKIRTVWSKRRMRTLQSSIVPGWWHQFSFLEEEEDKTAYLLGRERAKNSLPCFVQLLFPPRFLGELCLMRGIRVGFSLSEILHATVQICLLEVSERSCGLFNGWVNPYPEGMTSASNRRSRMSSPPSFSAAHRQSNFQT